ncbi:MAG: NAD-binding protein [Negativicutes bacterium]|nr:NAD-binding protein [Negativicutes bacterium]
MRNQGVKITKQDFTIIVGCGCLGACFANALAERGRRVLVLDREARSLLKLAPTYSGATAVGDGTDLDLLREIGMEQATFVLASTDSDTANLMIAQMAKEIFRIEQVIAKLNELEFAEVYQEFGIKTIAPGALTAAALIRLLDDPEKERVIE